MTKEERAYLKKMVSEKKKEAYLKDLKMKLCPR